MCAISMYNNVYNNEQVNYNHILLFEHVITKTIIRKQLLMVLSKFFKVFQNADTSLLQIFLLFFDNKQNKWTTSLSFHDRKISFCTEMACETVFSDTSGVISPAIRPAIQIHIFLFLLCANFAPNGERTSHRRCNLYRVNYDHFEKRRAQ